MADSLADWLRLREPADAAARSSDLARHVAEVLRNEGVVHGLDLATGTGANLRYLMARLPPRQQWLVVDRRSDLLDLQPERAAAWAVTHGLQVRRDAQDFHVSSDRLDVQVECRQRDLGVLNDATLFAGRHLVTASALLDLVSESWLRALAAQCAAVDAAGLFALTYNGESSCAPVEAEDNVIRDLLNEHQRTDKGLGGAACGPNAVGIAVRYFEDAGYAVRIERTDWDLDPSQRELQRQLIDGWAGAGSELAPHLAAMIADWRGRRLAHVDSGHSHIVVGHHDLAAWPMRRP